MTTTTIPMEGNLQKPFNEQSLYSVNNQFLAEQLCQAGRISQLDKTNLLADKTFMDRSPTENVNLFCKSGIISADEKPQFTTWEVKQEAKQKEEPNFIFNANLLMPDRLIRDPRYGRAMSL